jgi:hypothetical protein
VSEGYQGATNGELPGAPLARRVAATSASLCTPARRGSARLGGGAMMPDDRPPATVRATPEPPWPGPRSCADGGISSAPGRQVSSSCSPLPGNTWIADSAPVNGSVWLHLPGTPSSMHLANGSGGRSALEIHASGSLIEVMVASSPASSSAGRAR